MVKVRLSNPRAREAKDLASPTAVRTIWAEAAETVRRESLTVQRRRQRSEKPK